MEIERDLNLRYSGFFSGFFGDRGGKGSAHTYRCCLPKDEKNHNLTFCSPILKEDKEGTQKDRKAIEPNRKE